jgi:hypothetical protein
VIHGRVSPDAARLLTIFKGNPILTGILLQCALRVKNTGALPYMPTRGDLRRNKGLEHRSNPLHLGLIRAVTRKLVQLGRWKAWRRPRALGDRRGHLVHQRLEGF